MHGVVAMAIAHGFREWRNANAIDFRAAMRHGSREVGMLSAKCGAEGRYHHDPVRTVGKPREYRR
jgi:hypothetical protein